ncbi:hypothetical protein OKW96_08460 [Sphingobacterium sp. KU25419]|nr:hypothetical protein OKW96_08460 [Sphingobacterium sp. KU25419]
MKNEHRTIVRQKSSNGIKWNALDIVYTSSKPYAPENSLLLSPTFIHNGEKFVSYEVENNTGKKNFKGPDKAYVIRRTSDDGLNFTGFKSSKIVNFNNKPWLDINKNYSHWHIQCSYVDGYYFLCLNIGDVNQNTGDAIYLAYSKDGLNFLVFQNLWSKKTHIDLVFFQWRVIRKIFLLELFLDLKQENLNIENSNY